MGSWACSWASSGKTHPVAQEGLCPGVTCLKKSQPKFPVGSHTLSRLRSSPDPWSAQGPPDKSLLGKGEVVPASQASVWVDWDSSGLQWNQAGGPLSRRGRVTVADIEKELAELRESQVQGKATMENSVSEASFYLQEQVRVKVSSLIGSVCVWVGEGEDNSA